MTSIFNRILYIPKQIYYYHVNNFIGFCNPYSYKGIVVLNRTAKKIFDSINGQKSIIEIINYNKGILKPKETLSIIKRLLNYHIISFTQDSKLHISRSFSGFKSLSLWFQLTNQCNFRCTYCFVKKNNDMFTKEKIDKFWSILIPLQKKYNFKSVRVLIGGGEPLIRFQLVKYLIQTVEFHKKILPLRINIISNGSLVTEEVAQFLKKHHVDVGISLDGIGKFNDLTRKLINKKGTFSLIQRGLEIFKKIGVRFNVSITVTKKNVNHLFELALYCLKQNVPMSVGFYSQLNNLCKEDLITGNDEKFINAYKKFLTFVYNYYSNHHLKYSPLKYNNLLYPSRILYHPYYESCLGGINYFSVLPDESIRFCAASNVKLSSLNSRDFVEEARKNYLTLFKDKNVNNLSKCNYCKWRYICAGGCKQERIELSKTASPVKCAIYKKLIPHIINLEIKRIIDLNLLSKSV